MVEILPTLRRFPKAERYTVADKITDLLLSVVNSIYDASYSPKTRADSLRKARTELQVVGFLLRVSRRQGGLSEGHYETLYSKIIEIGKMLTGWSNSSLKKLETHAKTV